MPSIFRKPPPLDYILKFIQGFGLKSLNDKGWFSKKHVRLEIIESLLIDLEPYYLPCKAIIYIHQPLTTLRAITILRQLLKSINITLQTRERGRNNMKTVWYQIEMYSPSNCNSSIVQGQEEDGFIEFN